MKKILALNLVFLIIIGLCGCTFSDGKTALGTDVSQVPESVYSSQTVTTADDTSDASVSESTTSPSETESTSSMTTEPSLDTTVSQTTVTTTKASETTTSAKKETTTKKAETTKNPKPTESKPSTTVPKTTVPKTTVKTTKEKSTTSPKKETATQKAETTKQEQTESNLIKCTIKISCETIFNNEDKLKENKKAFVTKSGKILNSTEVTVPEGSSAFDVLKKVCEENACTDQCAFCQRNGIHFDFMYTPGFDSYYIRGIHQIYEKDCGTKSGWEYFVNKVYQNVGCNKCIVKNGDVIEFLYTCDLGDDL